MSERDPNQEAELELTPSREPMRVAPSALAPLPRSRYRTSHAQQPLSRPSVRYRQRKRRGGVLRVALLALLLVAAGYAAMQTREGAALWTKAEAKLDQLLAPAERLVTRRMPSVGRRPKAAPTKKPVVDPQTASQ